MEIKLHKHDLPSGQISLTDLGAIARAVQESVQSLVQWELGLDLKVRPTREVMDLSQVLLTQIEQGSTVLKFEPAATAVPSNHQQPAQVAMQQLHSALVAFQTNDQWPASVPVEIKHTLGVRLRTVLANGVRMEITDPAGSAASCILSEAGRRRLQRKEPYQPLQQVAVCGNVVAMDVTQRSFEVVTARGRTKVMANEEMWAKVDDPLRWQRVVAVGWPGDPKARSIDTVTTLRVASEDEQDGIEWLSEAAPDRTTLAAIRARLDTLAALQQGWDSYGAPPIDRRVLEAAETFAVRAARVLERNGQALPAPFVAPTTHGTVQFEWQRGARALELEIVSSDRFGYYDADATAGLEDEGECGSWSAFRLVLWLTSGVRP